MNLYFLHLISFFLFISTLSFIQQILIQYFLCEWHVLGAGDTVFHKADTNPCSNEANVIVCGDKLRSK